LRIIASFLRIPNERYEIGSVDHEGILEQLPVREALKLEVTSTA